MHGMPWYVSIREEFGFDGTLTLSVAGPCAPAHPLWQEGVFSSTSAPVCVFLTAISFCNFLFLINHMPGVGGGLPIRDHCVLFCRLEKKLINGRTFSPPHPRPTNFCYYVNARVSPSELTGHLIFMNKAAVNASPQASGIPRAPHPGAHSHLAAPPQPPHQAGPISPCLLGSAAVRSPRDAASLASHHSYGLTVRLMF